MPCHLLQVGLEQLQLHTDATGLAAQQKLGVGESQPVGLSLQRMAFVGMGLQLGPGVGEAALAQCFVFVVHGSGRRG